MAKRKVDFLTKKERNLIQFIEQSAPGFIAKIESGQPLTENDYQFVVGQSQKGVVTTALNKIKSNPKLLYQEFIKETDSNEIELDTPDLQTRLEAFQGLGQIPGDSTKVFNVNRLAELVRPEIVRILGADAGIPSDIINNAAQFAASRLSQNRFSTQEFADFIKDNAGGGVIGQGEHAGIKEEAQSIPDKFKGRVEAGEFFDDVPGTTVDTAGDVTRIQDILGERGFVSDEEAKVQALQAEIPGLLAKERERLYGGERERARNYLEFEYAPGVVEQLGRRGLEYSGEVGAAITQKGSELESVINQAEAEQIAQEENFWITMSYQNTFDKLIAARTGVAGEIENKRGEALTTSSRSFSKSQQNISNQFNLDLFRQENERALSEYRNRISNKQSELQAQKEGQLLSKVGEGVGTGVGLTYMG